MALTGDWIKLRCNLWDDPRVAAIVAETGSEEATIVGCLFRLWSLADQHTEDGTLQVMTPAILDRKTGVAGFSQAAINVGWLEETDGGLLIPRFDEHNGNSAKRRASDASRKASVRKTSAPKRTESGQGAELEAEAEAVKEGEAAAAARRQVFDSWNLIAKKLDLPVARSLTEKRSAKIDARLDDPEFAEHWQAALARLHTARFAIGQGSSGWKMSLDSFLDPEKFLKLTEGGYDNLSGHRRFRLSRPRHWRRRCTQVRRRHLTCRPSAGHSRTEFRRPGPASIRESSGWFGKRLWPPSGRSCCSDKSVPARAAPPPWSTPVGPVGTSNGFPHLRLCG